MSLSRKDESRMFVAAQLERGLGVYVKAEPNQGDTWRDTDIWHVTEHLAHEVEEVRRGVTLEAKYHNALDCVAQAAILAATIEQEIKRRLAEKP